MMKTTHPTSEAKTRAARIAYQASGQGIVEYVLIGAFVVLVLIAALTLLGPVISSSLNNTIGAFNPDATQVDPGQRDAVLTLVAAYTPESGSITTPPARDAVNAPPYAMDDQASTDQGVALNVFVLSNDYDPDGDILSIVSVQGKTTQNGSAVISDNNTPANSADDFIIYTPPANLIGLDAFMYTVNDGRGGSDSATVMIEVLDPARPQPTAAPSPTPSDIVHDAPFYDSIRNPDWWRLNQGDVFLGYDDWRVEWYTWSGTTPADATAAMSGIPACVTSMPYDQEINFFYGNGGPTPGGDCTGSPWRTDYFASRWTRTFGVAEDVTVTLTTIANEGIEVFIDSKRIDAISSWDLISGAQYRSTPYTFTGGVEHTIVIKHFDETYSSTFVFLIQDGSNPDVGQCTWAMSGEQTHTAPSAWSDSPGAFYANNSLCHVSLRGAVDLATLTEAPRMTFWERYSLGNRDNAWLQIREYGTTGPWFERRIHQGYSEQLTWSRQEIDLAAFGGYNTDTNQLVTTDWTGKTIEFRFVLETDGFNTADGWWIDDVSVDSDALRTYTVGFQDDMEGGNAHWLPGGTWAVSSERVRDGVSAWSDSPNVNYTANANATLQLDGVVNLTDAASVNPELVFYHSWNLGTNDSLFVEASLDGTTWVSLTPNRPGGALVTGTTNLAFVRETLSLNSRENPYQGKVFYLRFRLKSDGVDQGNGWWIDDIVLQNRNTTILPYPFFDDMENGGNNWLADAGWTLAPEAAYSGGSAWTDSPGRNYTHQTDVSLRTAGTFNLSPDAATHPALTFWHRRDLGATDSFSVEVSPDGEATWTPVWTSAYTASTAAHPDAPGTPLYEFNQQLAWEYVSVDLTDYVGTRLVIRFRLNALNDAQVGDGVWIDDVSLAEHVETPHGVPFTDTMEGTTNWRMGGTWDMSNEVRHAGMYALSDSPAQFYTDNTWSVLDLIEPINLTTLGADAFPVLSWWDRFSLNQNDYARLQIATWQGPGWSDWSAWEEVYQQYYTTTLSWDHRQVDLRPYIGHKIRVRFVLDALQNSSTGDGWWIDDVAVYLYAPNATPYSRYTSNATNLTGWTADGTWGLDSIFPLWGTNAESLGAGRWDVSFYDLRQYVTKGGIPCGGSSEAARAANALSRTSFAGLSTNGQSCTGALTTFTVAASATGTQGIAELAFNCGTTSSPHPNGTCSTTPWKANHDYMAIRFVRNFTVEIGGYYEFSVVHDDGVRLFIDDPTHASPYIDQWTDTTSAATHAFSLYLAAGAHTIEVWYYESSGSAAIRLDVARPNFSYHDSPGPGVAYGNQFNAALAMDGIVLDMTGASNPVLTWFEAYELANYDCIVTEVSLPYVAFDEWFEVYSTCGAGSGTGIRTAALRGPIEAGLGLGAGSFNFTNAKLAVRFRLDSRVDSAVEDGWWIDDIAVTEATS